MREIGKSLALTAVAIAGLLLSAVPASAHDDKKTLWRGSGKVWFPVADGSVWGNHHYVNSCDRKADGWGARTWYLTRQGWYYINDSNGSASGCGMTYSPDTILQFMVCYKSFRPEEECIGPFNA